MQLKLISILSILIAISGSCLTAQPTAPEASRTWMVDGKELVGTMANSNEKNLVILGADGKKYPTGKGKLSPEDMQYVQEVEAKRAAAKASGQPTASAPDSAPASAPAQGGVSSDGKEWANTGGNFKPDEVLKTLKPGYTFQNLMMPMRDGVELATTVFLPPGDGPWATILVRTPYERKGGQKYFKGLTAKNDYACVVQDPRGDGDSKGSSGDSINNEIEITDGYDSIDWVVKQSWCNGKVGMTGGSGNGMCAAMAYFCKHPNLVVVNPSNSAGNSYLYWSFENGVRRWMYNWLSNRNLAKSEWPKPTLYSYDMAKWNAILDEAAKDNKTVYIADDKWFNIFGDAGLDMFEKFAATGRVFITVAAGHHGGPGNEAAAKLSIKQGAPSAKVSFLSVLDGDPVSEKSTLRYAVMGDVTDPAAPGNIFKVANSWPPAHTPTSFYFTADGALAKEAPTGSGSKAYTYDPKNPASTLGGGWSFSKGPNGLVDAAPLKDRQDILRFVSEPLETPMEVAGKLQAELCISSDAPDSAFIVKFVDIYPDGKELIIREGAAMARYRDGLAQQAGPMEKDKVYKLAFPCNSTAMVFNKGHRIGIFVTSSSTPAYEVHPNTYEPVSSMDQAVTANHTIHCSSGNASRVILPVVTPVAAP